MPTTYNSKTKSSLSLILNPRLPAAPAILGNVLSITSLKTTGGEGEKNVCLIYLVLCASSSHHPFTESIEKTLHLPSQATVAKGLYPNTINLLWVWTNTET